MGNEVRWRSDWSNEVRWRSNRSNEVRWRSNRSNDQPGSGHSEAGGHPGLGQSDGPVGPLLNSCVINILHFVCLSMNIVIYNLFFFKLKHKLHTDLEFDEICK